MNVNEFFEAFKEAKNKADKKIMENTARLLLTEKEYVQFLELCINWLMDETKD